MTNLPMLRFILRNYKNFNSKDENPFPQYRPKLTVTYTTSGGCTVPTAALTATPGNASLRGSR